MARQKPTSPEDLQTTEIRYRRLFESVRDGILILDGETLRITDSNPYMTEILGYSHDEFLGKELWEIGRIGDKKKSKAIVQAFKKSGYLKYDEIPLETKEGGIREVEVVCNSYEENRHLVIQCNIRDVTARKELEGQLFQSQKMEAIGVLAGGIAHDFNNLLTVINCYSHMTLRNLSPEDPSRKYVEEVKAAGEIAAALTGQLLTFSRKQIVQQIVLNINTVVSNVGTMLKRIVRESIRFQTTLSPDLANIRADVGQIEQVIMNLAVNARDTMLRGGILKIETANVQLDESYIAQNMQVVPGPFVRLSISDTGAGMSKEMIGRIFEPFFTTKEVGEGTGLGLSTVHGIVKQAGGDIRVTSTIGKGTRFEIYFPAVKDKVPESKFALSGTSAYEGTETILLAEDETIVRKLIYTILTENGYNVLEARDGAEALEICMTHKEPIHLLLTDIIMPNMGGIELRLQALKHCADMKVIFMSGYADDATSLRGALGPAGFIGKPFSPKDLARTVRESLN